MVRQAHHERIADERVLDERILDTGYFHRGRGGFVTRLSRNGKPGSENRRRAIAEPS